MAFKAGEIVFQITAETKALNKAMGDVSANVQKNFGNIANTVGNTMMGVGAAVTGAVAGIGYKALSAAEEVSKASMRMVAALGLPKEEAERFRQMIREVYGDNFGESLTDVGAAIQEVALGLKDVGVTSNDEIVKAT
jgi:methyl-accepting chemotaxis protein